MENQGYPSKRQQGGDQPRRQKSSYSQPPATSTSSQTIDARLPQSYDIECQPLDQVQVDGREGYEADLMDWQQVASKDYGSIDTPSTTSMHADAQSSDLMNHMDEYVIVKAASTCAHSNGSGSNPTSGVASEEGPYYPPPFSLAADLYVDTGPMQEFQLTPYVYNQQHLLSGVGTQNNQQMFGNNEGYLGNGVSGSVYQEFSWNWTYQTSQTESFQQSPEAQNISSGPWNQTELRVPRYSPAYVAFGLTPEPEVLEDVSSPPRKSRPTQKNSSMRSIKFAPGPRIKDKSVSPGYENIAAKKEYTFVMNDYSDPPHQSGRKGPLDKKTRKKAAAVRKVRACWNCRLDKASCSVGEICQRCLQILANSKNAPFHQICSRFGLSHYANSFFPDFLHKHLTKDEVEDFINKHSNRWIGTDFNVSVTVGAAFDPMPLEVHSFEPRDGREGEICEQQHLTVESEEGISRLEMRFAAPVGIMMLSKSDMKKSLGEYLKSMATKDQYMAQTLRHESSDLAILILDVAQQYAIATNDSLVNNALKLYAMHYFMGTHITFTDDSANNVQECSSYLNHRRPQRYLTSRLLNRQLKYVMNQLQRELTAHVLESLDKAFCKGTKDRWGPCFAAILVLCFCIESLEVAADTFVVCDRKTEPNSEYRRDHSRAACENVETCAFQNCTQLFHKVFETSKVSNSAVRDKRLNPLRAFRENKETGFDRKTENMAKSIYALFDSAPALNALQDLTQRKALLECEDGDPDPKDIKNNNAGRLAAKFLMPFFVREG